MSSLHISDIPVGASVKVRVPATKLTWAPAMTAWVWVLASMMSWLLSVLSPVWSSSSAVRVARMPSRREPPGFAGDEGWFGGGWFG